MKISDTDQVCLKKLNLSILHWVQFCLITLKRKQIQIRLILKKDKNLIYNSQHSFTKFKDIDAFKELSLDSMYKKLNDFKKRFNKLKTVDPQTNENKVLKLKVLLNVGDLFNELYYIYKDKYNEEKDGLNTKNKKLFYYEKLRLTDDYQYASEKEKEEKEQQTSKKRTI